MNAGKSTHLLQSAYNYEHMLLFLPSIDGRAEGVILRGLGPHGARSVDPSSDLYRIVDEVGHEDGFDAVFVDTQFLTPAQVLQLTMIVDKVGISG